MIIEFQEVAEGQYNSTNIVNEFKAYIDRDMLGGYIATWESADLKSADEKSFDTFEEAAQWLDRNDQFIMTTNFDNMPNIKALKAAVGVR